MSSRVFCALILTLLITTACNLGTTPPTTEEELPTSDAVNAGQPSIQILSPADNASFTVNEQILVSVSATDSIGVTRVQLFVNGNPNKTLPSQFASGEVSFEGVLDFTPRAQGDYQLRVIAYRNAIASPPQEITVTVGTGQVVITQRPSSSTTGSSSGANPAPVIPNIPNDGRCRVLTNVGLNFRSEPTTTRENIITTFPQYTLVEVIARLGDNSWWKVSSSGRIGWVSGNSQYVTLYGNCSGVPIESVVINTPTIAPPTITPRPTNTPLPTNTPIPGKPDLTIPSIAIDEVITMPVGETEVRVPVIITVKNEGNEESPQFSVTLTVEGDGVRDDVIYDVATIGNLAPGTIITLTEEIVFEAADEYDIQVDVDPTDQVDEGNEVNNRADVTITVNPSE